MNVRVQAWRQAAVVLLCLGAAASQLAVASTVRFGVLDMQRIILNVEEGKSARTLLEKEIKTKEADFLKQKQELDKMNEDWKTQAALLSEEARMRKQQEFQEKFMGLRNAEMAFREEIGKKEKEATQKIAVKAAKLAETMAKEKKLTGVFETGSSGLIYLEDPLDLTGDVIASYNGAGTVAKKVTKK